MPFFNLSDDGEEAEQEGAGGGDGDGARPRNGGAPMPRCSTTIAAATAATATNTALPVKQRIHSGVTGRRPGSFRLHLLRRPG